MRLIERLQALGDRLGILEKAEKRVVREPEIIRTRTVTLAELMTEIRAEEVRALAERPAELSVTFEKLFETAGIKPGAHGWTIMKLGELLRSSRFRELERAAAQKGILETLAADKVGIEDLIKDAVARDKALDAYEMFVRRKMDERVARRARRMAEIETQVQALKDERARLEDNGKTDEAEWRAWRKQKQEQEKQLALTVGFLIDRQVITTGDESA
jgi:hypothetical protein